MIFVTGATGFIGQRLVVRLKAQGEKLKVLSRSHHPEFETVVCDLQRAVIPDGALEGPIRFFTLPVMPMTCGMPLNWRGCIVKSTWMPQYGWQSWQSTPG